MSIFTPRRPAPDPAPRVLTAAEERAAAIARVIDNYPDQCRLYADHPEVLRVLDAGYTAALAAQDQTNEVAA
jgi:hypothetical protein